MKPLSYETHLAIVERRRRQDLDVGPLAPTTLRFLLLFSLLLRERPPRRERRQDLGRDLRERGLDPVPGPRRAPAGVAEAGEQVGVGDARLLPAFRGRPGAGAARDAGLGPRGVDSDDAPDIAGDPLPEADGVVGEHRAEAAARCREGDDGFQGEVFRDRC